jgi:GMP synthase-like glutamine amidotransferase
VTLRIGVVANLEDPEAGFVEERLESLGGTFLRRWRSEPDSLDGLESSVDLLVLLGSDWSVYDPAHRREIAAESDLARRASTAGCPVLGICFGGQLVASAHGLDVVRSPRGEIGWARIDSDDQELFGNGPWFQFHLDQWIPGPPLTTIARNQLAPQAVRYRRTLGLQFHPEVTTEVATRWILEAPESVRSVGAEPDAVIEECRRLVPDARLRCHALVDAFLERIAGSPLEPDPMA